MKTINLRWMYPHYRHDEFVDVTDEVWAAMYQAQREMENYERRKVHHRAYYSLDAYSWLENYALEHSRSPEDILLEREEMTTRLRLIAALPVALAHATPAQSRRVHAYYIAGIKQPEISRIEGVHSSKVNADTIVGNCDTMLFLGGKEKTTLKEISEILGKETIDSFNTSENRGKEISHGLNYQKLGKELMTQDEIATMDGGMCILQLRGVRPFFSKKYDITKHPRYKYLSDADKKNTFDVERYIRVQRKKKKHPSAVIVPEEPFDLYEIELSDEDADFTVAE